MCVNKLLWLLGSTLNKLSGNVIVSQADALKRRENCLIPGGGEPFLFQILSLSLVWANSWVARVHAIRWRVVPWSKGLFKLLFTEWQTQTHTVQKWIIRTLPLEYSRRLENLSKENHFSFDLWVRLNKQTKASRAYRYISLALGSGI